MSTEKTSISVTGIWLRTIGREVQVLFESGGKWHIAIREKQPLDSVSHIIEVPGMDKCKPEPK